MEGSKLSGKIGFIVVRRELKGKGSYVIRVDLVIIKSSERVSIR